ncbi:MAG TPA: hypothetical protein VFK40_12680 [Nitrososphaeraceae archaeon]|nr:hypothetical protein [Nitrososphaeraceae archaeon]
MAVNEVNAEEEFIGKVTDNFVYKFPTILTNALLGDIEHKSFNATIQKIDHNNFRDNRWSEPSLSVLINNALLDNIYHKSFNATSLDHVKQQFIVIEQDSNNENIIFEKPDKQVQQITTTEVPFILPVPFP